jgi:hypothetical protein
MAWVLFVVGTYLRKKIDQRKLEALKSIRGERAEDDASLTKLVSSEHEQRPRWKLCMQKECIEFVSRSEAKWVNG